MRRPPEAAAPPEDVELGGEGTAGCRGGPSGARSPRGVPRRAARLRVSARAWGGRELHARDFTKIEPILFRPPAASSMDRAFRGAIFWRGRWGAPAVHRPLRRDWVAYLPAHAGPVRIWGGDCRARLPQRRAVLLCFCRNLDFA